MNGQEGLMLHILKQSNGATAVYDSGDLHIAFVNNAMLEIWGRDESLIGYEFAEVFPEFTEQGFTALLMNVWTTGKTYRANEFPADITINGVTETKYFDFVYQALVDRYGQTYAIVHTATDVSDRRFATHTVQEQEVVIAFNNELEVLTNTLSHDLKNPLAIAKMGLQYLQNHSHLAVSEKKDWIKMILDAVYNIEDIIGHTLILNQARLEHYTNECNEMERMIHQICNESRMLYRGQKKCTFEIGQLAPLYGDKGFLYQIFLNIIGNAVKYSSHRAVPSIHVESRIEGVYIVYTVKDNGIGIPEDDLPYVFHRLSRASNTSGYPGTGIGLCLVKKCMERIRGDVKIASTLGYGTCVELFFPIPLSSSHCCGEIKSAIV